MCGRSISRALNRLRATSGCRVGGGAPRREPKGPMSQRRAAAVKATWSKFGWTWRALLQCSKRPPPWPSPWAGAASTTSSTNSQGPECRPLPSSEPSTWLLVPRRSRRLLLDPAQVVTETIGDLDGFGGPHVTSGEHRPGGNEMRRRERESDFDDDRHTAGLGGVQAGGVLPLAGRLVEAVRLPAAQESSRIDRGQHGGDGDCRSQRSRS